MDVRCAIAALLAGCSGGSSTRPAKTIDDAPHAPVHVDAAPAVAMPTGPYRVDTNAKTGDVQIRVEWKDVPVALRASPGTTSCGDAALPALAPTTTWGIPDVVVSVETDHGAALPAADVRLDVSRCAIAPRVAIAGPSLAIASVAEQPLAVSLHEVGKAPIGAPAAPGVAHAIYLPIAGHEVTATLAAGLVYALELPGADAVTIVSATTPYVAITEATGQVIVRDVPIGTYPVRAWLPKRGAADARVATGQVTVTEGALTEVTLDLSSAP